MCKHTQHERKRGFSIIYFQILLSDFSCVSVALRIPLSLNNLRGACVYLQPATVISARLPRATAHLSLHSRSFPPCLSSFLFTPSPSQSALESGTGRNWGRLSWSLGLTPRLKWQKRDFKYFILQERWKGKYLTGKKKVPWRFPDRSTTEKKPPSYWAIWSVIEKQMSQLGHHKEFFCLIRSFTIITKSLSGSEVEPGYLPVFSLTLLFPEISFEKCVFMTHIFIGLELWLISSKL